MHTTEIAYRINLIRARLETTAPLIDGTDEGRALAKKAVLDAAKELGEIAAIVGGLME